MIMDVNMYEAIEKDLKTGIWTFDEYVKFLDEISGDSDVDLNMNLTNYGNTFVLTLTDDNENEDRIFYSMIEAENLNMDEFSGLCLYATVMAKYIYAKAIEAEKEEKEKCSLVKPGDKVVCVKTCQCFTQGKVYEVVDLFDDDDGDESCEDRAFCIIQDDDHDDRKICVSKEQVISNYWFMPLKEN